MKLARQIRLKLQPFFLSGAALALLISILGTILFFDIEPAHTPLRVGILILGDVSEPGWNAAHYEGVKKACEALGAKLYVRDNVPEHSGHCIAAIHDLAAQGCRIIFLSSYGYASEAKEVMKAYPNITFSTHSPEVSAPNLAHSYVRSYQGRYLSGVLAGLYTKSNVVGYIAPKYAYEVLNGINAFALGLWKINPTARLIVGWTGDWIAEERETEQTKKLIHTYKADVLTYHQDDQTVPKIAEATGTAYIGYDAEFSEQLFPNCLTSLLSNWEKYYYDAIQRYLREELFAYNNVWVGMDKEVVFLAPYSASVTESMRDTLAVIADDLKYQELIFTGPLFDRKGRQRCPFHEVLSDKALILTNWLLHGIEVLP